MLSKREIAKKKKLASQYKGISYDTIRDEFVVRHRIGTDINNQPIYIKPIKRYNDFEAAVQCLSEYKEMAELKLARRAIVTLKDIEEIYIKKHEKLMQAVKNNKQNETAMKYSALIRNIRKKMDTIRLIKNNVPELYVADLKKVTNENLQNYYSSVYSADLKTIKKKTITDYFSRLPSILKDRENGIAERMRKAAISENEIDLRFKISKIKDTTKRDTNTNLLKDSRSYNIDELHKMYITAEKGNDRTFLLLLLLIGTGARINELLNLSVNKIYTANDNKKEYVIKNEDGEAVISIPFENYIVIHRQRSRVTGTETYAKTGVSNRPVVLCQMIMDKLLDFISKHNLKDNDKIFFSTTVKDKSYSISDFRAGELLRELEQKAGVEHIKGRINHAHRHDLITYFENIFQINEATVRFFVGHSSKKNDAHSRYNMVGAEDVKSLGARRFKAAQTAFLITIIYNYDVDKSLQIFNEYKAKYENEPYKKRLNDGTVSFTIQTDNIDWEKVYQMEQSGKNLQEIKAELAIEERNEDIFDEEVGVIDGFLKQYAYYKEWRECLYNESRNASRDVRKRFKTFDDYIEYHKSAFLADTGSYMDEEEINYEMKVEEYMKKEEVLKEYYNLSENSEYRKNNTFADFKEDVAEESVIKDDFKRYCMHKINYKS